MKKLVILTTLLLTYTATSLPLTITTLLLLADPGMRGGAAIADRDQAR